ncbi:hypothetical protein NO989_04545 [Alteromonas sp. DY56-G5]|jgi:hypothetical protein|uniref:hypothetical protein n=1 Tax=Alteromonas sp. DY56-G5 TaxID=2967128 RepID=UPI00352A1CB3
MKNKLSDLNNHLFAQLERLGDEDIKGDELKDEIERGKSMASVAKEIVSNAKLALDVAVKYDEMSQNAKQHVDGMLLENK